MKLYFTYLFIVFTTISDAQNWIEVPNQINTDAQCLYTDSIDNLLYLGGIFGLNGTDTVRGVATWNNSTISGLAEGMMNFMGGATSGIAITDIERFQNKIYVSGDGPDFTVGDSIWTRNIGVWDGTAWDSIHYGLIDNWGESSGVTDLKVIDGELYVAGGFTKIEPDQLFVNGLAKFDGNTWYDVHNFPQFETSIVKCIAKYNNEIYVAGVLLDNYPYDTMYNICHYNGTEWKMLGNGIGGAFSEITDMQVYDGKLYVCGSFNKFDRPLNPGNRIAAWDGTAWEEVVNIQGASESSYAYVKDMCVYNGELYVVGRFEKVNGYSASNFAKFDGIDWCVYDDVFDSWVNQIEVYDNEIYISGFFDSINSTPVLRLAKLSATATPYNCSSIIGVEESNKPDFLISPNPTTKELHIEFNQVGNQQIKILDFQGRVVSENNTQFNVLTINVSNLESGAYFVVVSQQGKVTIQKIVKF